MNSTQTSQLRVHQLNIAKNVGGKINTNYSHHVVVTMFLLNLRDEGSCYALNLELHDTWPQEDGG